MKKSAAFTLIELLVVIAIIAILAGIALPVFNRILEKGRVTQDCSNMRQMGIGTVAYLNDNNDTMMNTTTTGSAANGTTIFAPALLSVNYVPNLKVFQSPFDKRTAGTPNPISYGINSNIINPSGAKPPFDGNMTRLVAASQLVLYAPQYVTDPTVTNNWQGVDTNAVAVPASGNGMGKGTHQNGRWIDVLYADMHVASIKFSDFQTDGQTDNSPHGGVDGFNMWQPLGHGN
jgi:prepilin-type N-terminal cleavage/methylation domain-containing protein